MLTQLRLIEARLLILDLSRAFFSSQFSPRASRLYNVLPYSVLSLSLSISLFINYTVAITQSMAYLLHK